MIGKFECSLIGEPNLLKDVPLQRWKRVLQKRSDTVVCSRMTATCSQQASDGLHALTDGIQLHEAKKPLRLSLLSISYVKVIITALGGLDDVCQKTAPKGFT